MSSSQSLYLLGQKSSSFAVFQRIQTLMKMCAQQGDFLSYETTPEWLSCYERDAQLLYSKLPLVVFRPFTCAQIIPFIQACYQLNFSVTTRCGGTGLTGSCVPSKESVVLLTGHLKQMKNYDKKHGRIDLEPGVTIRQLNRSVDADQWHFPLSMASGGVAGMAGCISCQARGYHQQQYAFFDAIKSVALVDGQGQILEVPSALVCGAEGLWGVILGMKVQLKRKFVQQREFNYRGSWQALLKHLPALTSLQSLSSIVWKHEQFYLKLETEAWRLDSAVAFLLQTLPGIQPLPIPCDYSFLPSQKKFMVVSSVFHQAMQLPEACQWSLANAKNLQLTCEQQVDVLAGSLHLILQAQETVHLFAKKCEQFLILWADFVDRQKGSLASCHGVGMQMRPYMTPFWSEETQQMWRKLQMAFDPKELFSQERFFPPMGKSLEKVRNDMLY